MLFSEAFPGITIDTSDKSFGFPLNFLESNMIADIKGPELENNDLKDIQKCPKVID